MRRKNNKQEKEAQKNTTVALRVTNNHTLITVFAIETNERPRGNEQPESVNKIKSDQN